MGRMSDIDIDTREFLKREADQYGLDPYETEMFVSKNYEQVSTRYMKERFSANKSNKPGA